MLINEVDAIPQRNCLNLSDLKKEGGARRQIPPRSFTHLMHSVVRMLSTQQQNKENRSRQPEDNGREEETKEVDRKWFPTAPLYAHAGP